MKLSACRLALAVAIPVAAQNGDPSGDPATVAALESALLIERALTSEDRERFRELANRRRASTTIVWKSAIRARCSSGSAMCPAPTMTRGGGGSQRSL